VLLENLILVNVIVLPSVGKVNSSSPNIPPNIFPTNIFSSNPAVPLIFTPGLDSSTDVKKVFQFFFTKSSEEFSGIVNL